jgi:predicted aspartyl protease
LLFKNNLGYDSSMALPSSDSFQPIQISPIRVVPHPASIPSQSKYFTMEEEPKKGFPWGAIFKLLYIAVFIVMVSGGAYFFTKRYLLIKRGMKDQSILLQHRYQPVLWKDFGVVFEPIIKVPVYYPGQGYVEKKFLLDSGALVSSLPREEAEQMNFNLAMLPRSTFAGFGGTTSFAYKAEIKVKVGDEETILPVVFTEAGGTKAIIGRSGFFEKYSIYFNAENEMIEIRD